MEGSIVVRGRTIPLKHVYLAMMPDDFDETRDALYLALSDAPIDDVGQSTQPFAMMKLGERAAAGALNAVVLRLGAGLKPLSGDIYSKQLSGGHVSMSGNAYQLSPRHFEAGRMLAGKVWVAPQEGRDAKETWQFSATFSTPMIAKVPERTAAPDSPPALTAEAFRRAVVAGDQAAIRALFEPGTNFDHPDLTAMLRLYTAAFQNPDFKISKIILASDDEALVTFSAEVQGGRSRLKVPVTRVAGQWRVVGMPKPNKTAGSPQPPRDPMPAPCSTPEAATCACAPAGGALGTLRLNGGSVSLRYAYASFRDALYVLLSDVPLLQQAWQKDEWLQEQAKRGALHALEIKLDENLYPAGIQIYSNRCREEAHCSDSGWDDDFSAQRLVSGELVGGTVVFEPKKAAPDESSDGDDEEPRDSWEYRASFTAEITPTALDPSLAGIPPALVARAFVAALAKKDVAGVKKSSTPMLAGLLASRAGPDTLKDWFKRVDPKLEVTASEPSEDGEHTLLTLSHREDWRVHTATIALEQSGGRWLVRNVSF